MRTDEEVKQAIAQVEHNKQAGKIEDIEASTQLAIYRWFLEGQPAVPQS